MSRADVALPAIFEQETVDELKERAGEYLNSAVSLSAATTTVMDLPELDIDGWPPKEMRTKNQRHLRAMDRVLTDVLEHMRAAIFEEIGEPMPVTGSQASDEKRVPSPNTPPSQSGEPDQNADIDYVVNLALQTGKRAEKSKNGIRSDVELFTAWMGKKRDMREFTKADLVSFATECLPYVPKNMTKYQQYEGKTLKQCVHMVKEDPEKCIPISHRTCVNRMRSIITIFNYAKKRLGIIPINYAEGIDIPEVRVIDSGPRAYTRAELKKMWKALFRVHNDPSYKSSWFWSVVLGLYHGFRLEEICSLDVQDVYEDEDGITVIDLKRNKVKTDSSSRIVPVHPYVLNDLGFGEFVREQKSDRSEGLLFDVKFVKGHGYHQNVSDWFNKRWKSNWLSEDSMYKDFHGLRHTFSQWAQNEARMDDRCSQEITGHKVTGVSSVHMGYSGRLPPKILLEELEKLQYGWEDDPLPVIEPPPKKSPKKKKRRYTKRKTAAQKSRSQ